ncbi:MAG: hypothetical protein ACMXYG_05240 [Candidatus Woesearchaeota archaeon]
MRWMYSIIIIIALLLPIFILGINNATASASNADYWSIDVLSTIMSRTPQPGSGIANLKRDPEEMTRMRQEAQMKYRESFLYGLTTDGILDQICNSNIPRLGQGTAFVETDGKLYVGIHVSGEKRPLVIYNETNETTGEVEVIPSWQYKFSILVDNKQQANTTLKFNVYIDNVKLYNDTQEVKKGSTFNKIGANMITQVSENNYNKICIRFQKPHPIVGPLSKASEISELCNNIVLTDDASSPYNAPSYMQSQLAGESGGTGGSSGPSDIPNQI